MAKQSKTIKMLRESDGATKEIKASVFTPFMKEAHLKKGFRVVSEEEEIAPKKVAANKPKPEPVIPAATEEVAKEESTEEIESVEPTSPSVEISDKLSVKELKDIASERGIDGYGKMKKSELIDALK